MPILDDIQIKINADLVGKRLHLKRDKDLKGVQDLIGVAESWVEPKVLYKVRYIEEKLVDGVVIQGLRLISNVLRKNLAEVERVFPFVITIGKKFGKKMDACDDLLEKFYLDTIGNVALNQVRLAFQKHLKQKYAIEKTAFLEPGSLADWPIEQQRPLFKLLGNVQASIGVRLTDSLLMLPAKSISGVYFPTETSFFSCQLCPRERCESRRAKYSAKLAVEYGIEK
ncbi:hypothetical protein JY97_09685 [Alkalispirochaeta odontotermitis]|nr:hypothetical protein JY97_09685 [Alkalispirochaeta odontotermitis]CAB1076555.1 hypothetical protein D1AOALGA4SA_4351 [Olavius algarvensis Delta 1 endosymbiont]